MFEQGEYFSVLYCLCLVNDRSANMLDDQSREEVDPDLEWEEELIFQMTGRIIGRYYCG